MERIWRFHLFPIFFSSLFFVLITADPDTNDTITSGPDLPDLTTLVPAPTPSAECLEAKTACENDTDCYHRLFYSHTTCVSGACKPQCKTAILRLYETKLGRQLLHSDFTCLGLITTSVVNCQLDPRSPVLHCTLAKLTCELDDDCSRLFDDLESKCEKKTDPFLDCIPECAGSLASVFNHSIGRSLANCTCWSEDDVLCRHMKETMIDSCKPEALVLLETHGRLQQTLPLTTPIWMGAEQTEMSAHDFRNSNVVPVTKKPKVHASDSKKAHSASSLTRSWCIALVHVMVLLVLMRL